MLKRIASTVRERVPLLLQPKPELLPLSLVRCMPCDKTSGARQDRVCAREAGAAEPPNSEIKACSRILHGMAGRLNDQCCILYTCNAFTQGQSLMC